MGRSVAGRGVWRAPHRFRDHHRQALRRVRNFMARSNAVPKLAPESAAKGKIHNTPPVPDLDRVIHPRIRLGIVSALAAANDSLTFNDLKRLLQTTDGNVSVHARKLEEAGYIACTKSFEGRMPKTEYSLTPAGRHALEKYLNHMEALIRATKGNG